MKKFNLYESPAVIRIVRLVPEADILQGSVVDQGTVSSVGQEVDAHDFSTDSYNHTWE